jgi:hypothetical protein
MTTPSAPAASTFSSNTPAEPARWYRFEDKRYAPVLDEYEYARGSGRVELEEHVFEVVRTTPKGVWLVAVWGEFRSSTPRFMRLGARRAFAHPTREQAMTSYIARKRAQMQLLQRQLESARVALFLGEKGLSALYKGQRTDLAASEKDLEEALA